MPRSIEILNIYENSLTNLDLSENVKLEFLKVNKNILNKLNLKNDNNERIDVINLLNNPFLKCVFVDNKEYSNSGWGNSKDETTHFVESQEECDDL